MYFDRNKCFGLQAATQCALQVAALLIPSVAGWNAYAADTAAAKSSDRGFYYIHDEVREMPWSIHILKIERSHKELQLDTVMGHGVCIGMSIISQQVRMVPPEWGRAIAAVNGDFYNASSIYYGDPDGLQIMHGELVSSPNPERICVWVDAGGNPRRDQVTAKFQVTWPDKKSTPIGINEFRDIDGAVLYTRAVGPSTRTPYGMDVALERNGDKPWLPLRVGQTYSARVRQVYTSGNAPLGTNVMVLSVGPRLSPRPPKLEPGAILEISTATTPDLAGAMSGIGGGPTLVEAGKLRPSHGVHGSDTRHPRAAIGWNKDYIFLIEVDGRQRNLSIGMTLPELARYMQKLGCEEAINLDGGGSATMWVMGNVMNSPSNGGERPAANAVILLQTNRK